MSKQYSIEDVARHFGMTRSQAYRELQSWPHQGHGTTMITFTQADVEEITRMLNAGPDEQLARLTLMEQKRRELEAQDLADEHPFDSANCQPWCTEHLDGAICTSSGVKGSIERQFNEPLTYEIYVDSNSNVLLQFGTEGEWLTTDDAKRIGQGLLDQIALLELKAP